MNDPLRHVKPAVRALRGYPLVAREAAVKVNQNENPWDVPAPLKARIAERVLGRSWSRYPDPESRELRGALAAVTGRPPEGILVGNGSNELIEALLRVTVSGGTAVIMPDPTFSLYSLLATILGGEPIAVPLGADFGYVPGAIRRARLRASAPLTILGSPNNPTGGVVEPSEVRDLLEETDGLVVVDEAYHEFSGTSVLPLLEEHENLVVLRTFSKAWALAGLRIGYLLASPRIAREVQKARLPYSLNLVSQEAALAVLEEPGALRESVERIVRGREALRQALGALPGVEPYPSRANFILFEVSEAEPSGVFRELSSRGVLVRDVSPHPRLARCLRVSVGSELENAAFLEALSGVLAGKGVAP